MSYCESHFKHPCACGHRRFRSGTRSNSSFHVLVVVGFEALAFEALEGLATVVERAPGFGKGDAADARRASEFAGFAFDVHDAPGLRFRLARGRPANAAGATRLLHRILQVGCSSAGRFGHTSSVTVVLRWRREVGVQFNQDLLPHILTIQAKSF